MAKTLEEKKQSYTSHQWALLCVLGMVNFLSGLVYSIQAPFYPAEAEKKRATASEYGMVFGSYELTTFIICPIIGNYLHVIGPKMAFNLGIITAGISIVLFGFLDLVRNHIPFITLSFILRITEAIGSSTVFIAMYTFVTVEFPNSVATSFAILETIFGFGICVGPTIGSVFFELGGFTAPFAILGGALFATAVVTSPLMERPKPKDPFAASAPEEVHQGVFNLMRIPEMSFYSFCTLSGALSNGFLAATLEPHLREYHLTPIKTGLMFLVYGGTYAVITPIWGAILDRLTRPKYIALAGALLIMGAFLLIGPASIIPLKPQLDITALGLVLFGLGWGAISVSSFLLSLQDARKFGFPDNAGTYSLVSGVWRSSLALGAFLGPSIAGILYDKVGFRNESLFVVGLQALLAMLVIGFIIKDCVTASYKMDYFRNDLKDELLPVLQKAQQDRHLGY